MKVFVFGYNRFDSMTTSLMLESEGIDHTVLCHTEEQREAFIGGATTLPERLRVTGNPKGLAYNRNAALDLMEADEWALFLVDDLKSVTELRNYSTARDPLPITNTNQRIYAERFRHPLSMQGFLSRAEETAKHCEKYGAKLGGFCGIDNPMFRKPHWGLNVFADGRALIVKKSDLRFDENVHMIDDICWTALNIRHFGAVVVNRWVLPTCQRYASGGYGSIQARLPQKLQECAYLVETFPELIAFKEKAGQKTGSHVTLRPQKKPRSGALSQYR